VEAIEEAADEVQRQCVLKEREIEFRLKEMES
jgi:hypothetical protein